MLFKLTGNLSKGADFVAQALRDRAVSQGHGGLILSADNADADPRHLVEKLLDGYAMNGRTIPLHKLPFKGDRVTLDDDTGEVVKRERDRPPVIIAIGEEGAALIDAIDKVAPGFGDATPIIEIDI